MIHCPMWFDGEGSGYVWKRHLACVALNNCPDHRTLAGRMAASLRIAFRPSVGTARYRSGAASALGRKESGAIMQRPA